MIAAFSLQSENYTRSSSGSGNQVIYNNANGVSSDTRFPIPWATVTLKCSGNRFVWVGFVPYSDGSNFVEQTGARIITHSGDQNHDTEERIYFVRDSSTDFAILDFRNRCQNPVTQTTGTLDWYGTSWLWALDRPAAGNHTYTVDFYYKGNVSNGRNSGIQFNYAYLVAKELLF